MPKPRWTVEDKDFWIDMFITSIPAILTDVPNYDNDEKLIHAVEFEDRVIERITICAKACDKALAEMQFRFWDNARGNLEDKVRFGARGKGPRRDRDRGTDGGRNKGRVNK